MLTGYLVYSGGMLNYEFNEVAENTLTIAFETVDATSLAAGVISALVVGLSF